MANLCKITLLLLVVFVLLSNAKAGKQAAEKSFVDNDGPGSAQSTYALR